jgi:ArsR family transcriptional regulator, arsenate/arsenite/antimonite-responsive transcriptional repressor
MAVNRAFRALADPTRRRILRLLRERRRTSGEIADAFPSSWPTISRHLAVLRSAGLIVRERKGQFIEYDVNTTVLQEVIQLLLDSVPNRRSRWQSNIARSLPSPSRSPHR